MFKSQKVVFKLVGIICALTIIIGALYAPMALAVKAADIVNITFVDEFNNTENTISGNKGEGFTYPADPVDENGEQWFMGWFTDKTYQTEHVTGVFGDSDLTLYAEWLCESDAPSCYQDFENYTKDQWELKDPVNDIRKNNRDYFFEGASKQSDITYNNSGYAIKMDWDADMVKDATNPNTYDAAGRWKSIDRKINLDLRPENHVTYTITFKYYVEKADTDFNFTLHSAWDGSIWSFRKDYATIGCERTVGWHEATATFTTDFDTHNTMFLIMNLSANKDVTVYIDDVAIEAVQPYDSFVRIKTGLGGDLVVKGVRGESIELPQLTHPLKADFEGYYSNENFTTKFTAETFQRKELVTYAKWGPAPITFEEFPYDIPPSERAYYTFSIKKGDGVGYDDNSALNFLFDGDKSYQRPGSSEPTVFYTRYNTKDNSIYVDNALTAGALYKISFYTKSGKNSKSDYSIMLASGDDDSIWWPCWKEHLATRTTFKASNKDWQYCEFFISPTPSTTSTTSSALYLQFNSLDGSENSYVDAYLDNLVIEKIVPPYIFFDHTLAEVTTFVKGEVGKEIVPPTAKCFAKTFTGWYTDAECTTKFTETHFTDSMAMTLYAGWKDATEVTYTFENFDIPHRGDDPTLNIRRDIHLKTYSKAVSGKNVLEVDRTHNQTYSSYVPLANGKKVHEINGKNLYVITLNYAVSKKLSGSATIKVLSAMPNNYWGHMNYGSSISIPADTEVGKWKKATLVLDSSKIPHELAVGVFLEVVGGTDGKLFIDDVTIKTIPLGNQLAIIDNGDCNKIPTVLYGKTGQNFASKLPTSPTVEGKYFKGYFVLDESKNYAELKREDMKFAKDPVVVYARFINTEVTEDFESDSVRSAISKYDVFSIYDFDYELYDSTANGNSSDNVTSGKYSLHRKGNTNFNENALVLGTHNSIAEGERYTVTFKVKLGEHKHTNGAVKIVSCRNYIYSWDTMGDYYPVVAIADLADGQWHEVSYTFNSIESFVSVQTPGQVELFFDDFKFTLAKDTPISEPVNYTEHLIGVKANSDGVDITTIIDESLLESSISIWLIIGIAAAVLVLVAGIVLVIAKRKKA